jgi:hypothetical protein
MDVVYKPYTTSCGHLYCKACIIQWWNTKKNCPNCKSIEIEKPTPTKWIDLNIINQLKYHCFNKGCDFVDIVGHNYHNVFNHQKVCKYKQIKCKYCEIDLEKKDLDKHIAETKCYEDYIAKLKEENKSYKRKYEEVGATLEYDYH